MMPKHVLVAEDDHDILDLVLVVLEDSGFRVSSAVGAETLKRVRADRPDLILLDYQMPGMDGITIAQQLKADPDTADIPIVAMTAAGRAPIICHEMDAAGCLGKPFDIDSLVETCDRLIHMTH
jgi:CheY-like chemotaxis protein